MAVKPTYEELERRVEELETESIARKKTEGALCESEEKHRFFAENMAEIVWTLDRNFRTQYVTPTIEKVLGFTPEERKQQSLEEMITPESLLRLQERFMEEIQHDKKVPADLERAVIMEVEYYRRDGTTLWMENSMKAIRNSEGTIVGVLGVSRDITERKQAEDKIENARQEWEDIFQAVGHPTLILDSEHRLIHANRAAEKATGTAKEDLIGKKCCNIFHNTDGPPEGCPYEKMITSGHLETVAMEMEALGGVFLVSCTPMLDEKGRVQKVIHIATDITGQKHAEEALRDSESKLRSIMANSGVGILVIQDGKTVYFNAKVHEMLGYSKEEYDKLDYLSLVHPEDRALAIEWIRKRLTGEGQNSLPTQMRILTKSGDIKWIETSSVKMLWDGRPAIQAYINDITARKKASDALKKSQQTLKIAQDVAKIGSWWYDPKTQMPTWTEEMFHIFGLDPEPAALPYEAHRKIIHPDDWELFDTSVNKAVNEGIGYNLELRITRPDGEIRYVNARCVTKKNPDGTVIALIGTTQDITERKLTEETLRESEERFSKLFFSSPTWLGFNRLADGKFLEVNESFERVTGFTREEVIGRTSVEIGLWYEPESREEFMKLARERGGFQEQEVVLRNKKGDLFPVLWSAEVLELHGEECLLSTVMDTSALKRAEEEKDRLQEALQQSQKMEAVGTLAGGIAHDFNNILGIILGNAELAMDDVPEWNPASQNLDEVKKGCMRAKDVVRQILSFSRKSEIEKKSINIASVLVESLKLSRASIPTSIEIRQNIANDVDDILGDTTQIHQVMINLCTNAAHAMEKDGGILDVTLENSEVDEDTASQYPELNPGPHVHLGVRDTGDGIKPEIVGRIFDPYFTTKDVGKGTGMGLAVVHGIVKSHHGSISVESEPGKGTTFKLLFPAVKEKVGDEPKDAQELPTGTERILFVDDEESMVDLNQQRLERLGYHVISKTDPLEALEFFRTNPDQIDLVISDMTMPHMTGDRLAQEILKIRPDMPIILCTGYSQKISKETARELGIRKYIEKPIEKETLARSIREGLDGK
jgi:PAS domain S-box-containing protein